MQSFTRDVVMAAASGHYNELAMQFLPQLSTAIARPGRHVPDPFKSSSKDGFRVFKDFCQKGKMIFNNNWGENAKVVDFFELMMLTGVATDFSDALEKVGSFLNCPRTGYHIKGTKYERQTSEAVKQQQKLIAEAKLAAAKAEAEAKKAEEVRYQKGAIAVQKQLEECIPLTANDPRCKPVWDYLVSRGLGALKYAPDEVLKQLFCARNVGYFEEGKLVGNYDCLISKVNANNKLWSLHRIFIKDGKKAPVSNAKKMQTPAFDGTDYSKFIKLGDVPEHGVIGIAEGIETALACYCGTRIPTWSAISATFLEEFYPPKNVKAVIIFADNDLSGVGQKSAKILKEKLNSKGIKAYISLPKSDIPEGSKGIDWLDELNTKGVFAFPDPVQCLNYIRNH